MSRTGGVVTLRFFERVDDTLSICRSACEVVLFASSEQEKRLTRCWRSGVSVHRHLTNPLDFGDASFPLVHFRSGLLRHFHEQDHHEWIR